MSSTEIRQKLFDYILHAEDSKIEAMYSIIENEFKSEKDVWTDDFLSEMDARVGEYKSGNVQGFTWEQVKERINSRKQS